MLELYIYIINNILIIKTFVLRFDKIQTGFTIMLLCGNIASSKWSCVNSRFPKSRNFLPIK